MYFLNVLLHFRCGLFQRFQQIQLCSQQALSSWTWIISFGELFHRWRTISLHGYYGTSGKEKIIKSLVIWMWILRIPLNWQKRTISSHGYYCTCPMARDTWRRASIDLPPAGFSQNSVFLNLYHLLKQVQKSPKDMNIQDFPWILWDLWKSRNGLAFERKHYSSVSV